MTLWEQVSAVPTVEVLLPFSGRGRGARCPQWRIVLCPTGLSYVPPNLQSRFLSVPGGNLFTCDLKVFFWHDFNTQSVYTESLRNITIAF